MAQLCCGWGTGWEMAGEEELLVGKEPLEAGAPKLKEYQL